MAIQDEEVIINSLSSVFELRNIVYDNDVEVMETKIRGFVTSIIHKFFYFLKNREYEQIFNKMVLNIALMTESLSDVDKFMINIKVMEICLTCIKKDKDRSAIL